MRTGAAARRGKSGAKPADAARRNRAAARQPWTYGIAGVVIVLAIWQGVTNLHLVNSTLLSSPTAIVQAGFDQITTGALWPNLEATLMVWVIGFAIASVLGIAIGIFSGLFRRFRAVAEPWLNAINVAPDLAFVPILILWLGIGLKFKIVLVVLIGVFYVAVNTLAGVRSTEGALVRVAQSFGASRARTIRTILLPGSVPYIVTGLRQGAARSIIGVIVAEFVSANKGIGFMISLAGNFLNTPLVFFGIALLAILGFVISVLLGIVERHFASWRPVRE